MTRDYAIEHLGIFIGDKKVQKVCGKCKFYVNGCTTSQIENKHVDSRTPACSKFIQRKQNEV